MVMNYVCVLQSSKRERCGVLPSLPTRSASFPAASAPATVAQRPATPRPTAATIACTCGCGAARRRAPLPRRGVVLLCLGGHGDYTTVALASHTGRVRAVHVSRGGQCVMSGSRDGTVRVWSVPPRAAVAPADVVSPRVVDLRGHAGP
jgi:WD domain, G-beta repeat